MRLIELFVSALMGSDVSDEQRTDNQEEHDIQGWADPPFFTKFQTFCHVG